MSGTVERKQTISSSQAAKDESATHLLRDLLLLIKRLNLGLLGVLLNIIDLDVQSELFDREDSGQRSSLA